MGIAKLKVAAVILLTLALTCLADGLLNRAAGSPAANQPTLKHSWPTSTQDRLLVSNPHQNSANLNSGEFSYPELKH